MICSVPTSALRGVPLNSRSFASNFSHDGSALPSASVAVQGQPVAHIHIGEGRGRHLEARTRRPRWPVWSAMALASVGASLVFSTVTLKVSVISSPALSVAVNEHFEASPTSPLAGVPEKVRVAASNFSHAGQRGAAGEPGGVGQGVAIRRVHVVERAGGHRRR
jgi:type IV secretory pathway TrbL component